MSQPPDRQPLADRPLGVPHPSRLDPGRPDYRQILAAHQATMDRGDPGYTDPGTGLFVLTAAELAERGECCDSGCRHCPYVS